MSEHVIDVKDLVITYKTVQRASLFHFLLPGKKKKKDDLFTAVKGVSFSIEEGQIVGIVGKNGSGKSTMLRSIAGVFSPNSGSIDIHGRSISLLSIGVGFERTLSGRENIYLSGLLLGFTKEQIREREESIIAFSITAILETDIMLIDEVLSVGDVKFKRKSYEKMKELIQDDKRTVLIVSHSSETIRNLCSKVLWLHDGELKRFGETEEVLAEYEAFMN